MAQKPARFSLACSDKCNFTWELLKRDINCFNGHEGNTQIMKLACVYEGHTYDGIKMKEGR